MPVAIQAPNLRQDETLEDKIARAGQAFMGGYQGAMERRMRGMESEEARKFREMQFEAARADANEARKFREGQFDYQKAQDAAQLDLAKQRLGVDRMNAGNTAADRRKKIIDDKTERLAGKLGNSGDLNSAIQNVEKQLGFSLDSFDPETSTAGGKAIDLPGVSLPLVGRVTAYDTDARTLQSKIGKIFNVELKDRSGAAVTNPEMERLREEFGTGKFNSEAELIGALKDYKEAMRQAVANIESGYDPEVRDVIGERGGFTSAAIPRGAPPALSPPTMNAGGHPLALTIPSANAAPPPGPAADPGFAKWKASKGIK